MAEFQAGWHRQGLAWRTTSAVFVCLLLTIPLLLDASAASATGAAVQNEPSTPVLDDFDGRGLEDPLYQWGNWAPNSIDGSGPTLEILGGSAGHNEGQSIDADSYRVEEATSGVEAYATITAAPDNNQDMYVYINLQQTGTPGWDGYRARWFHWIAVDGLYLEKVVDGVVSSMVPPVQLDPATGDTILIRNNAGTIELWHKSAGSWILRLSASDGDFHGGKIGLGSNNDKGRWDDFGGTGATTPPPTAPAVPATGFLDEFERPNEDPLSQGGAWSPTSLFGTGQTLEVLGNAAGQNEAETIQANSFRAAEMVGDAEVHARIATTPDNNQNLYLYLHLQEAGTAGVDGYRAAWFHWISTDGLYIQKVTNGVATTIAGPLALDPATGDTLLLRRFGLVLELWRKNAGTWSKLLSALDESYTSGRLGLGMDDERGRWDDFGGGTIGAPPPPPPPPPPSDEPPVEQSRGICAGSGVHAKATSRCLSDPVNTLTGAFITSAEDLSLPGSGVSLAWNRTYTSSDPTVGRLGAGWTDGYATSLSIQPEGDVTLHGDEGQLVSYRRQPDGTFAGAAGALSSLRSVADGYELVRTDQVVYVFDAQGRLLSTKDRNAQGLVFSYDGTGRLTGITDAAGRRATLSYAASGLVSEVSSPDGRSVRYGYTGGQLTSVNDVRGKTWRYTYDAEGRLATIVDPLGRAQVTNAYGANGRVQSQTDALGKTTTFEWDQLTQTATVTDANGNVWRDDYDGNVLSARLDGLGNTTKLAHDGELNTSGITTPGGETTSMTYDARGNLLSATAPASLGGVRKTFAYNTRNDPTQITDARGTVTAYTYDAEGNTERVVRDGVQIASYTHDGAGRVLTSTDANSKTTTYAYDADGNVVSETGPAGNVTTYTYDDAGRVVTRVDPRGNAPGGVPADFTWRWTYNAAGQVLTERDPLGGVTTHAYDDTGNEASVAGPNGKTTTFAYDAANRLVSETLPDPDGGGSLPAPVTIHSYDGVGNRLSQTDAMERTTTFAYDAANRLVSTTGPDPDGAGPLPVPVTTNTYDEDGHLASTVEPRGNVAGSNANDFRTKFTYDAAGRLLTTTDPLGNTTTNAYDAVGNLSSVRDANGHTTAFTYDGAGRILTVTGADGGITAYTYDAAGNRLTRRDASGHLTAYAYDAAGRLASETFADPDGTGPKAPALITRAYDANGNLASTVDPNGNATSTGGDGRTTFAYDAANRLVSVDYSDSTADASFAYDAVGNRVSMTDGSGTETRAYDGLNRLLSVARGSNAFSYLYDAVGDVTRRTYPGGGAIDYAYDGLGRLATVTSAGQTTSYGYDAASNLTQTTLPSGNGHVETRLYDRAGRLTEVTTRRGTTTLAGFVATLDGVGNPTRVVRTGALAQTQTYVYDPNDRIVSVCFQAGTCPGAQDPFIRWTYDRVGNRLAEQRPSGTTTYTYDAADRLIESGSTTYTYDENGNQLSAGARTFTYDLANRLRTTRLGSTTTTYAYDGDGVRLQSSTGSAPSKKTNFLWDVNHALPQIALERNGSGSVLREYSYGQRRISMTTGSDTSYFHYDSLGSVASMTSSSGSPRWTWSYEPFGLIRTEQRSTGSAAKNSVKFTGEYLDPTGLYHLRARQYDPASSRFLRPDPVEADIDSPLVAAYVYAANRPTVFVDPSGETYRAAADGQEAARFSSSSVDFETPLIRCQSPQCGRRPNLAPLPTLVHPIPAGYPGSSGAIHPTGGIPQYLALDFFPGAGAPVLAVQSGTIYRFSGNDPRLGEVKLGIFGWSLYLKADSGSDFFYTHLGSRVGLGRVRAGQVIGRVGSWFRTSGENKSHLHLGVYGGPVSIEMVRRAPRVRA